MSLNRCATCGFVRSRGRGSSMSITRVITERGPTDIMPIRSASEIAYNPLPKDDPQVRRPDITRARQLLHWEPKVDRREGLALTLGYFRMKVGSGSGQ